MIVVMSHSADQKQVDLVCNYLDGRPGLRAHASQGIERVIIGVIGQIYPELQGELEQMDGVGEVRMIFSNNLLMNVEIYVLMVHVI